VTVALALSRTPGQERRLEKKELEEDGILETSGAANTEVLEVQTQAC